MKRVSNLYEQIISVGNLRLADEKARRGKANSYGVQAHDRNREANIQALHEALLTKTFRTSQYDVFTIHEPKERIIYRLPYYPDRIVHHAIMNVLEDIWVRTFTHNTFSCVKGRGIEGCAQYVTKIIRKYNGRPLYCLKIDIRKFYPSIKHRVLMRIVRRKIKDKDLLWLLDEIICSVREVKTPLSTPRERPLGKRYLSMSKQPHKKAAYNVDEKDKTESEGLPIGNYLSQYLANLVLCYFMHKINEVLKLDSAEYADDIIFLADNKETLRDALNKFIRPYIEEELELKLKDNWQIFPIAENRADRHGRALDFVGYKFYRRQKFIRKSIKQNFCRAAARLNKRKRPLTAAEYKQAVAPWLGWAKHSNSKHLLKTIIKKEFHESIL